jgi:hypothetical protein
VVQLGHGVFAFGLVAPMVNVQGRMLALHEPK